MTQTLEAIHAELKALRDGGLVAPGLDESLAQHEAEHRALLADNAALLKAGNTLAEEPRWSEPNDDEAVAIEVLEKPHPGAALLSEMEALRKRVECLDVAVTAYKSALNDMARDRDEARVRMAEVEEDKAHWDEREATLKAEADHLRGVIVGRTEERDEARAQVATARSNALREVAEEADYRAWMARSVWPNSEKGDLASAGLTKLADDVRSFATTPPPPVVPVAKVREVALEAIQTQERQADAADAADMETAASIRRARARAIRDFCNLLGVVVGDGEP